LQVGQQGVSDLVYVKGISGWRHVDQVGGGTHATAVRTQNRNQNNNKTEANEKKRNPIGAFNRELTRLGS